MKLALWQTAGAMGQPAEAVRLMDAAMRAAAAAGAGLLLCPELFLCGYNIPDAIGRLAEPADGPSARAIAALCAQHGLSVAYGFAERAPGSPKIFNSVQMLGPDGASLALYRKTHLFGPMERALFTPGDRLGPVVALGGWRVGLLVCYDIEFPECARTLALQGADLLLVPTALPDGIGYVPEAIIPARAAENGIYVAYCNRCGTEAGLSYSGQSRVAGPDGRAVGAAGMGETLLVVEIDLVARAKAAAAAAPYLADRRPGLYAVG